MKIIFSTEFLKMYFFFQIDVNFKKEKKKEINFTKKAVMIICSFWNTILKISNLDSSFLITKTRFCDVL